MSSLFRSRIIILPAIILLMCSCIRTPDAPRSESDDTPTPVDVEQSEKTGEPDTDRMIADVALDLMVDFGYERSSLTVSYSELMPGWDALHWIITLEDDRGEFASVAVDENLLKVEAMKFFLPTGESDPAVVRPGDDLPDRIAEALRLEEQGYRRNDEASDEYNSVWSMYVTVDDREISVGDVFIDLDTETGGLHSIHWFTNHLAESPAVR